MQKLLFAASAAWGATAQLCPGTVPPPSNATTPLSRWPYLTAAEEGTVSITWGVQGDNNGLGVVEYLVDGVPMRVDATVQNLVWYNWNDFPIFKTMNLHTAVLTGLPASQRTCYRVFVDGQEMAGGLSFTSPSNSTAESVSFVAWGDFGVGSQEQPWYRPESAQARVRDAINSEYDKSEFLLALGDNTYFTGKAHEYDQRVFPYYYEQWAQKPLFLAPGNHDYPGDDASGVIGLPYLQAFQQKKHSNIHPDHQGRYYSFDWGPVHFVCVDTEWFNYDDPANPTPGGMLWWLEQDLRSHEKDWLIVFQHKMPYTGSSVADQRIVDYLVPLYEKYGVHAVVGGHWHNYQRYPPLYEGVVTPTDQGGVTYVISGGGGYQVGLVTGNEHHMLVDDAVVPPVVRRPVYHFTHWEIQGCTARLQAITDNLDVIDDHTITRC